MFEFKLSFDKMPICRKKFRDINDLDDFVDGLKLKFRGKE